MTANMNVPQENEEEGFISIDEILSRDEKPSFGERAEQFAGEAQRHVGRSLARVGESLLGLPGDLKEFMVNISGGLPEALTGEETPKWRQAIEKLGPEILLSKVQGPTSSQVKKQITERLSPSYFEPQNEIEAKADEVVTDVANLLVGGAGKISLPAALGKSLLSNLSAEAARAFGGGEKTAQAAKLGTLVMTDLISKNYKGPGKFIGSLYEDMRSSIPEGAEIPAKSFASKIRNIEKELKLGDPKTASKQLVFDKIKAAKSAIKGKNIDPRELEALLTDTNEVIYNNKDLMRKQNLIFKFKDAVLDSLGEYGKENPEFFDKWKLAKQATAATKIGDNVSKYAKQLLSPKSLPYSLALFGGLGFIPGGIGAKAATLGIAAGGSYIANLSQKVARSPALRKYYMNAIKSAADQNKSSFLRAAQQLNTALEKESEGEEEKITPTFTLED